MRILIIDDFRSDFDIIPETKKELQNIIDNNIARQDIVIVRNYKMGINMLENFSWDMLYLDHDIGGEKTGYDVIKWMENELHSNMGYKVIPNAMVCVSANPSGKKNIEAGWDAIQKALKEKKSLT